MSSQSHYTDKPKRTTEKKVTEVTADDLDFSNKIVEPSPEISHGKEKKSGGLFTRLKNEINEGIENQAERKANAPGLSRRGVIGVQLSGGFVGGGFVGGC